MSIYKGHGSYLHDFSRFDLVPLCAVDQWDLATLCRRAEEKGFLERDPRAGDIVTNKEWVILDQRGDRALVLYNQDSTFKLSTLAWAPFVGHLVESGYELPQAIKGRVAHDHP